MSHHRQFPGEWGTPEAPDSAVSERTQELRFDERTVGMPALRSTFRSSGMVVAGGFLVGTTIAGSVLFGAFYLGPRVAPTHSGPAALAPPVAPVRTATTLPIPLPPPDPAQVSVRSLPPAPVATASPPRAAANAPRPTGVAPAVRPTAPPVTPEAPAARPVPLPVRSFEAARSASVSPPLAAPVVASAAEDRTRDAVPTAEPVQKPEETPKHSGTVVFVPRRPVARDPAFTGARPEPDSPVAPAPGPVEATPPMPERPSEPPVGTERELDPARLRTQAERDAAWELRRRRVRDRYRRDERPRDNDPRGSR